MSLSGRVNALASRISQEIKMLRQEMAQAISAESPAGGVLGGTYPNPGWAANVVFVGKAILNGLIVTNGFDVRGTDNKFAVGSVVTLHDKTAGSVNAPVLASNYELGAHQNGYLWINCGFHLDTDETNRHSAGFFFQEAMMQVGTHQWTWPRVSPMENGTGDHAVFGPYTLTRIQNSSGPRTIVWGEEYKQTVPGYPTRWKLDSISLRSYDDAPILTGQPPIDKATPLATNAWGNYTYALGRSFSASGSARASEFCSIRVPHSGGLATLQRWTCEDAAGFVVVQTISNVSMSFITSDNTVKGVAFGSSARMGFHGTNQDVWVVFTKSWVYVYNAAATSRITDLEFPSVPEGHVQFAIGNVDTNTFGGFRSIPWGDSVDMSRYTDISWPDTDSSTWWAGYTWYDSVGTTHETNMSVPGSITMKKRSRLTVSTGPLPDPAAGAGTTRGPDDVNSFRLYLSRGAVKPPNPQFYRQTLQPADLATTIGVNANPVFSGAGLAPPVTTNFPGAGPALFQSSAVSELDGTPKLRFSADGSADVETLEVGGPVTTGLYGRGIDQLYYVLRGQQTMSGGGRRTVTGDISQAYVTWNARFLVISLGRGPTTTVSGHFAISVPPATTNVIGVGGALNRTALASGVPLKQFEVLWYELPFGSNEASLPGNFRVTSWTSDFVVPNNWVMIALHQGDTAFAQWGDGVKTGIPGVYDPAGLTPGTFISRYSGAVDPTTTGVANDDVQRNAYIPPTYTVPANARTAHALIQAKGRWVTNAACNWWMRNNVQGDVAYGRVHNGSDPLQTADVALFAIIPVTPGNSFQCWVAVSNDAGSGSYLALITSYFTYTFMS